MASAAATLPSETPAKSDLPPIPHLIGFFLMCFGMFMAILDIQIVSASLREIQAGLSASSDEIVWVQSSYLIAEVVMIPLSGFLSRGLSTRWLFVLSSGGFTLASALCATATSINEMIVYRALQGFLGGAMIPMTFATSYALFGRTRQIQSTIVISLIVTMAPTVGPVIGGWITEHVSWHWLFLVNLLPGVLVTFGVMSLLDIDAPDFKLLRRIDVPGLLFMALFLGGLEFVLEEGPRKRWFEEDIITICTVLTITSGVLFFLRLATAQEPIVRLHPFKNANFAAGSILGAIGGMGLFGLSYLYPLYLGQVAGLSSGQIGNILFVSGLAMILSAPMAGILARKYDARITACLGMLILAASSWLSQDLTLDWRFEQFLVPQILRGIGLMVTMVSVNATAFASLPAETLKDASGLFALVRNLGGAVGLAFINSVILWRSNFHWARAIEHVNPSRPEVADRLEALTARMEAAGVAGDPAAAAGREIGRMVMQQVNLLTFSDCFTLMIYMFMIAAIIPLFLRKPDPMRALEAGH